MVTQLYLLSMFVVSEALQAAYSHTHTLNEALKANFTGAPQFIALQLA